MLTATLWYTYYYYPYFTDDEYEALEKFSNLQRPCN